VSGHDKENPAFYRPPDRLAKVGFPRIITKCIEKLESYYHNPSLIPSLSRLNLTRQQRSERREACVAMLQAMIQYLDITTLRVVRPRNAGGWYGVKMVELAGLAGLNLRRAERACHDLVASGIVKVFPIAEKIEAGYRGSPAIRTISKHLFNALSLGTWLDRERARAYKRTKGPRQGQESRGKMGLYLESIKSKLSPGAPLRPRPAHGPP